MPEPLPKTMADRGTFWTQAPDWRSVVLQYDSWTARPVLGLHRLLVSGNLDAALGMFAPAVPSIGLWQVAAGSVHPIRVGRDRMLLTAAKPLVATPGWNASGFAVSPATDAYVTIEISGPGLRALVSEMTFADLEEGSPSAATLVCGQQALLHRVDEQTARIHVEAPLGTYVWHWLETR
ncbi:hypothetical protein [Tianweitania sediminis]|uniref:Uncharacterized protein n=1 Tax=Tianweitania sediminis TaxID=1502156 RepID=A0A8J7UGZ4_9HYPH|nr:hypothetical protein [Tianweitania sediminis]MBP0437238.1 hypothetical protein [Tianweitania sediminis]